MTIPLLDLQAQYASIEQEVLAAIKQVFHRKAFILGPEIKRLEKEIADYSHTGYAVGVASGTDALLISLMALGVGPGDEVITTPFTFFSTAGSISRLGAKPVFVDIDEKTYNILPDQIELKVTSKTKAIIPVHLYGQCADMDPITDISRKYNIPVVEDAAQAVGAEYVKDSRRKRAGSMGKSGCFSFFPSKNLGGIGDGGMVVTNDAELAEMISILRVHGSKPKYYHKIIGLNSRLDTIQAAVVLIKLKYLDEWSEKRRKNAKLYDELFTSKGLPITLPYTEHGNRHIYNQYVIRTPRRDQVKGFLKEKGVTTEIYYPLPLHLQECYRDLGYKSGDLPNAEKAARETLALPIYPELTPPMQERVVDTISDFLQEP